MWNIEIIQDSRGITFQLGYLVRDGGSMQGFLHARNALKFR